MRFRIDVPTFRSAVERASHATTPSALTPILDNILIDARFKKLILIGNNLEIAIESTVTEHLDIESEGKFTISSRFITSYLALVQEKDMLVELEKDGTLRFETKSGETKFKGTSADKFPLIPQIHSDMKIEMTAWDMKRAIEKTIFSTADGAIRPMLAGIYLRILDERILFASTDSYRLSEFSLPRTEIKESGTSLIIPKNTATELVCIFTDEASPVFLSLEENQLLIQSWSIRLSSRLLSGKFPDYEAFFPKDHTTKAVFQRSECINVLKQVNLVARNNHSNVCARFDLSGKIEISSWDTELWKSSITLPASVEWAAEMIKFNAQFLLDVLSVMREEHISLDFRSPLTPIVIRWVAGEEKKYTYRHLIMPLKI